jgi:choice-of-anchor B domain-containing protein
MMFGAMFATPATAQQFGGTVAVSADDVIVGERGNRNFPGTVYVYRKSDNGVWTEAVQLGPSTSGEGADGFGSVLVADDATLVVGAPGNSDVGAVFVFQKNAAGDWVETTKLSPTDLSDGEAFGTAVALSDGVMAVSSNGGEGQSGAVYVFRRNGDMWSAGPRLHGSDSAVSDSVQSDNFGASLSIEGNTLIVGAPSHNERAGAVYVFRFDEDKGSWLEAAKLESSGGDQATMFGQSVGLWDGLILASAPGYANRAGALFTYAFDEEEGEWRQRSQLSSFDAQRFAQFGTAFLVDGNRLWVGAPGDKGREGALYAIVRDGEGNWSSASRVSSTEVEGRGAFGAALAMHGNIAVVGATGVDRGAGAAVILERDGMEAMWIEKNVVVNEPKGFAAITGGEAPCTDDKVDAFECSNVDVASFLPIKDIGGGRGGMVNDIWGWTDPVTDKEYALVGRSDGTSFVDVTDPFDPVYVGDLPKTEGSRSSSWRDIKVYKDHAFIVSDAADNHGMQVFDLTQLRDVTSTPVTFEVTALYDKINSSHNIVINEDTGYAYSVGSSSGGETCGGGLHMINIQDPANPTFAGCFADPRTGRSGTGYTHDAQCVIYHGPDADYKGREICLGSNESALSIADVTDKETPVAISTAVYPNVAYAHQGWLSEDHRYFYMNDEGDEGSGLVEGTRTLVWDLEDLDDPVLAHEYIAKTTTTDHNLYIEGDLMYQSNYGSGLRILDIADRENPVEIGFFDTTPFGGGGSWSNYPYFKSGYIVVTSMGEGLFVLRHRKAEL